MADIAFSSVCGSCSKDETKATLHGLSLPLSYSSTICTVSTTPRLLPMQKKKNGESNRRYLASCPGSSPFFCMGRSLGTRLGSAYYSLAFTHFWYMYSQVALFCYVQVYHSFDFWKELNKILFQCLWGWEDMTYCSTLCRMHWMLLQARWRQLG